MASFTAAHPKSLQQKNRQTWLWLLCAASVAVGVYYLSIVCCAQPGGDDEIINTQNYYYITHTPLWQVFCDRLREVLGYFTLQSARFRPFTAPPAKGLSSFFLGDVTLYRLYIIAYTYADILLLGALLRKALRSNTAGLACISLMPFMFCLWEDSTGNSLYAYGALVQSMLLPVLLSGLCMLRLADTGRLRWAVGAGYCAFHACAVFETAFVYVVPLFGIAWLYTDDAKKALRLAAAPLAGECVALAFNLAARAVNALRAVGLVPGVYEDMSGIAPHFDLGVILRTWAMQMSAAFPLNPLLLGRMRPSGIHAEDVLCALALAALAVAALALWQALPNGKQCGILFLTGLAMLSAPALIIALSPKYQDGVCVDWVHGYIPQVVESFGVGLMALALAALLLARLRRCTRWQRLRLPCAVLAVLILAGCGVWQRAATRSAYAGGGRDYRVFVESVRAGLLPAEPDDGLIVSNFNIWGGDAQAHESFYLCYSDKDYRGLGLAAFEQAPVSDTVLYRSGIGRGADDRYDFAWLGLAEDSTLQVLDGVRLYLPEDVPTEAVLHYTAVTADGPQECAAPLSTLTLTPAGQGHLADLPAARVAADGLSLRAD